MKKVLLVTAGIFHPTYLGRLALHKALNMPLSKADGAGAGENFSFTHVSSLEKLPPTLDSFSALVLHYHHKTISDAALEKLDSFVRNGGGVLAIHAATASFKETLPYFEILGGRFIGHGPVEKFKVRNLKGEVFGDLGNFVVTDELYIHELQPGIQVHFTAKHEGKDVPVVWTYKCGKGKVCYAVPGHTTKSMQNKTYQEVLKRGLMWVTE